jgi:3-deoxy-7-phosphoheptulonate synthase
MIGVSVGNRAIARAGQFAAHQPDWPDPVEAARAYSRLTALPPLTSPTQVRRLSTALCRVVSRRAFVLQAGDCAEPFGVQAVEAAGEKYRLWALEPSRSLDQPRSPCPRLRTAAEPDGPGHR